MVIAYPYLKKRFKCGVNLAGLMLSNLLYFVVNNKNPINITFTKNGARKKASILNVAIKVSDKSSRNEMMTFADCIELNFTELPLILIGMVSMAKIDSVRVNKNPEKINI